MDCFIFAQIVEKAAEVDSFTALVQPIVNLVTMGGFGALVWYLIVKHIPNIEQRHQNERVADELRWLSERKDWITYIHERDKKIEETTKEFTSALIRVESLLIANQRRSDSYE